jgi:4-amino-4-deoxy-L-arabinose transferase-like glycosyltransferase
MRWPWLIGLLVFVIAAFLRLSLVSTSRFTDDEAAFYRDSLSVAKGASHPRLGPPITGGEARHPGPAFFYLMAVSQWISPTPEAANAWVALLGAFAVLLFWWALREPFGERAAALAALMYACSPWATLYSDRIWNSNVIPFLVALALWAALRVRTHPGSRTIAVGVVASALMPQFHLSSPVIWMGLCVLVAPSRRHWNRRWLLVGLLVAALLYLPYLSYEWDTHFGNLRAYLADGRGAGRSTGFLRVPLYALRLLTLDVTYQELSGFWGIYPEGRAFRALWTGTKAHPFHWLTFALTIVSYGWALYAIWEGLWKKTERFADYRKAILWALGADVLLLAVAGKPFYGHYLQPLLPMGLILYAWVGARTRQPELVAGLAFLWCLGGIEATWSISRRADALNGLATERKVLSTILQDLKELNLPASAPVSLTFGFIGSPLAYRVLAESQFHTPLHVVSEGGLAYFIAERGSSPPPTFRDRVPRAIGPVDLYR